MEGLTFEAFIVGVVVQTVIHLREGSTCEKQKEDWSQKRRGVSCESTHGGSSEEVSVFGKHDGFNERRNVVLKSCFC